MNTEIRPSYVDNGREYYNRTNAAKFVQMTDTGFRRKIDKLEKEEGIIIPVISRAGAREKLIDRRILEVFREPAFSGYEKWLTKLKEVIALIESERG